MGAGFRSLAFLVRRDCPLHEALAQSAQICGNSTLKRSWIRISKKVRNGESFELALESEPTMPENYRDLIIRSLKTGRTAEVLMSLATYHDTRVMIQKNYLNRIIPLLTLLTTTTLFGVVWSFHMMPLLRDGYTHLGTSPPIFMNSLFALVWIVPSLAISIFLFQFFFGNGKFRTNNVKRFLDLSTALKGLSIFVGSGMPLHVALRSVSMEGFVKTTDPVQQGESLNGSLDPTYCPESLRIILEDSVKNGTLGAVSDQLSDFYRTLAFAKLNGLIKRVIPILFLICALIAALAVFSGYFSYFSVIKDAIKVFSI